MFELKHQKTSSTDNSPANKLQANRESSSAAQKKNIFPEILSLGGTFSDRPQFIRAVCQKFSVLLNPRS
jgi:hypothetical protein